VQTLRRELTSGKKNVQQGEEGDRDREKETPSKTNAKERKRKRRGNASIHSWF
jgi:hypothetical protein